MLVSRIYFIVAMILIFEVTFRLWPSPQRDDNGKINEPEYHFYPTNQDETDSVRWYTYHIFEHAKAILFSWALFIVFSRLRFLIWMFGIDLAIYLLNYNSTLFYWGWLPVGADTIKLAIFGTVVIREALTYYDGLYPGTNEHRSFNDHAHSDVSTPLRTHTYKSGVRIIKASVPGNSNRRKTT